MVHIANSIPILKLRIYVIEVSFVHTFNYLVSVTAGQPKVPSVHVAKFYGRLRFICCILKIKIVRVLQIDENCNFDGF